MSEETPQEQSPEQAQEAPPARDELAGLPDDARRLVERANSEAAGYRHELREVQEQLQALRRANESEQERRDREIIERERAAGRAERDEEVAGLRRDIAIRDIRALAASSFADPNDAIGALALAGTLDALLRIRDESQRDAAARRALAELLEAKPYLGREQERAASVITQGARSSSPDGRTRERSWLRG